MKERGREVKEGMGRGAQEEIKGFKELREGWKRKGGKKEMRRRSYIYRGGDGGARSGRLMSDEGEIEGNVLMH